jgi:hypothetical protein
VITPSQQQETELCIGIRFHIKEVHEIALKVKILTCVLIGDRHSSMY